ncbi:MAG TPA: CHAT domain-containing protein, partial [Gemmataceae bacterium]|nr:CHAT domain-containing protein [Gemmataceae bacterium]
EGRLESGELVDEGLRMRVDEADVVVLLVDPNYLKSPYCMEEAARAMQRHGRGETEIRAYAVESVTAQQLKGINVFVHRGSWSDGVFEQRIIEDVEASLELLRCPIGASERRTIANWLKEDGRTSGPDVRKLLEREGVPAAELNGIAWQRENWLEELLSLPKEPEKRQPIRERLALFLVALAAGRPERRGQVTLWIRQRRLVGLTPKPVAPYEYVVNIDPKVELAALGNDSTVIGQSLGKHFPDVFNSDGPLVLQALPATLVAPLEWTRENEQSEPVAVRRPMRWRLAGMDTRRCLFDELSDGCLPPKILLLAAEADDINPKAEVGALKSQLQDLYRERNWPAQFVCAQDCETAKKLSTCVAGCCDQIVHFAGHLGATGLRTGSELLPAAELAAALATSDVRLLVLNGCEGGTPQSPTAFAYATLVERVVRDAGVPEVVAHRGLLSDSDAGSFARVFYRGLLDHFDPSRAVFHARKKGSNELRLSPVLVSQRAGPLS